MKYSIAKAVVIVLSFLSFVSCDKDFNSLGSDLIDGNHFVLERYPVQNLTAYSKATGPVQSNNLPINALGIYKDPYFGTAKAHFVSQVELSTPNPTIGYQPVIDSVYLFIPYFSTYKSVTDAGERLYDLNSIYGNSETAKFKLHVYEKRILLKRL